MVCLGADHKIIPISNLLTLDVSRIDVTSYKQQWLLGCTQDLLSAKSHVTGHFIFEGGICLQKFLTGLAGLVYFKYQCHLHISKNDSACTSILEMFITPDQQAGFSSIVHQFSQNTFPIYIYYCYNTTCERNHTKFNASPIKLPGTS